jgi:hypothetical protein
MLELNVVDHGYCLITGYPDGNDWLVAPGRTALEAHGIGGDRAWFYDDRAELHIFDAPARRRAATLALGNPEKHGKDTRICQSRDGRRLYALTAQDRQQVLRVVDLAAARIVETHDGFPHGWAHAPLQRPDGKLLLPFQQRSQKPFDYGLVLFDPATGERAESRLRDYEVGVGFVSHSPDGRWWVRMERGAFPVLDVAPTFAGRVLGRKPERYYGLTMQLWEAFPLRFVRRITVAWLTLGELPSPSLSSVDPTKSREIVWEAIAQAAARRSTDPAEELTRADFPAQLVDDERMWLSIEDTWRGLGYDFVYGWQPDGGAFWIRTNGLISCVGVDGTISPRLYLDRLGLKRGLNAIERELYSDSLDVGPYPTTLWPDTIEPLEGRRARASYRVDGYEGGVALLDGASSTAPHRISAVAKARDHWVAFDAQQRFHDDRAIRARIAAHKAERKRTAIPLAAWTEADCIAAIDAMTKKLTASFLERAVDGDVQFVFQSGAWDFDEEQFFTTVRERFPGAAPAIRRLIERYLAVHKRQRDLFWRGAEGIGIFGHAVRTLAVRDPDALQLMRRYGRAVDIGHEHFFSRETVPAVIAAHGWTDAVIDFVIWVMLRNFYNTLQDYNEIWTQWGMGKAVKSRFSPEAFARRVAAEVEANRDWVEFLGDYGAEGLDQLAKDLPREPWVREFLAALKPLTGTMDAA